MSKHSQAWFTREIIAGMFVVIAALITAGAMLLDNRIQPKGGWPSAPIEPLSLTNRQDVPTNAIDIAALFGGQPDDWKQLGNVNAWNFQPQEPTLIKWPVSWRADFTDANFIIFSCDAQYESGLYGPNQAVVRGATLWHVPGEIKCPHNSVWSQNHS